MDKTIRYLGGEVQIPTKVLSAKFAPPLVAEATYQYCRDKPPCIDNFNFSRGRQVHRLNFCIFTRAWELER